MLLLFLVCDLHMLHFQLHALFSAGIYKPWVIYFGRLEALGSEAIYLHQEFKVTILVHGHQYYVGMAWLLLAGNTEWQ